METFLAVIASIVAVGALYVVAPMVGEAYFRFRKVRKVTCPENLWPADIEIDAGHAAATAAIGRPDLRISDCSRWPEHGHCAQQCLMQVH